MKRLARFLGYLFFAIILLPVVDKALMGQQRPLPRHEMRGPGSDRVLPLTEYTAPFIYQLWWAEIAICEGFDIPTAEQERSVQWFSVPAIFFASDGELLGQDNAALAGTYDREAVIYVGQPYIWDESKIEHEMMHMILHWVGIDLGQLHPERVFEICGLHISYPAHW